MAIFFLDGERQAEWHFSEPLPSWIFSAKDLVVQADGHELAWLLALFRQEEAELRNTSEILAALHEAKEAGTLRHIEVGTYDPPDYEPPGLLRLFETTEWSKGEKERPFPKQIAKMVIGEETFTPPYPEALVQNWNSHAHGYHIDAQGFTHDGCNHPGQTCSRKG